MNQSVKRHPTKVEIQEINIIVNQAGVLKITIQFEKNTSTTNTTFILIDIFISQDVKSTLSVLIVPFAISASTLAIGFCFERIKIGFSTKRKVYSYVRYSDQIEIIAIVLLTIIGYEFSPVQDPEISLGKLILLELFERILFISGLASVISILTINYFSTRKKEIQYLWITENGREKILKNRIPVLISKFFTIIFGVIVFYPYLNYILFGPLSFTADIFRIIFESTLIILFYTVITTIIYLYSKNTILSWVVSSSTITFFEIIGINNKFVPSLSSLESFKQLFLLIPILIVLGGIFGIRKYMNAEVVR